MRAVRLLGRVKTLVVCRGSAACLPIALGCVCVQPWSGRCVLLDWQERMRWSEGTRVPNELKTLHVDTVHFRTNQQTRHLRTAGFYAGHMTIYIPIYALGSTDQSQRD